MSKFLPMPLQPLIPQSACTPSEPRAAKTCPQCLTLPGPGWKEQTRVRVVCDDEEQASCPSHSLGGKTPHRFPRVQLAFIFQHSHIHAACVLKLVSWISTTCTERSAVWESHVAILGHISRWTVCPHSFLVFPG